MDPIYFIHVPKTAGVSIFEAYPEVIRKGHTTARHYWRANPERWAQCFSFGFVRNPWDRMVSAFYYGTKGRRDRGQWGADDITAFRAWMAEGRGGEWMGEPLPDRPDGWNGNPPKPEAALADESGHVLVKYVGRYENLQQDMDEAARRMGLEPRELPRMNDAGRQPIPYQDFYDDRWRDWVEERSQFEIQLFGYRF